MQCAKGVPSPVTSETAPFLSNDSFKLFVGCNCEKRNASTHSEATHLDKTMMEDAKKKRQEIEHDNRSNNSRSMTTFPICGRRGASLPQGSRGLIWELTSRNLGHLQTIAPPC